MGVAGHVCMAQQAPYGAHKAAAAEKGLVVVLRSFYKWEKLAKTWRTKGNLRKTHLSLVAQTKRHTNAALSE